jgi:hypothetical protein
VEWIGTGGDNGSDRRVESDVVILREVMRGSGSMEAQLSDCCPSVKENLTNLERDIVNLKEEDGAGRLNCSPRAEVIEQHLATTNLSPGPPKLMQ